MANARINPEDKKTLEQLCQDLEVSQPTVLHLALSLLYRHEVEKRIQAEFEDLAKHPEDLAAYRAYSEMIDQAAASDAVSQKD